MGGNKSTLRPEVIQDLKETTAFSANEIGDLYRQYVHDCQGNLHMTKEQFIHMYDELFPDGEAKDFAEHVFRTFDKQGKGEISFRQFMTTLSVQLKGSLQEKLTWAFDLYDINRNGDITREETMEMIQVLKNMRAGHVPHEDNLSPEQLTNYIFRKAGVENQDRISQKGFVHAAMDSKTMLALLQGTFLAAAEPFVMRKERSGSFGRPRSSSQRHLNTESVSPKRSPRASFSSPTGQEEKGRRGSLPAIGAMQTLKVQEMKQRSGSFR